MRAKFPNSIAVTAVLLVIVSTGLAAKKPRTVEKPWPELLLDGGRKVSYEQSLTSNRDVRGKQRLWSKLLDVVAGQPDVSVLVRPFGVAVDSEGRVIVTDPGVSGVHIFDVARNKYKFIDRFEKSSDPLIEPQCVAVDREDNIYVTDSKAGKIFVFDRGGKTRRIFGSLRGGEGFFKRPTGIAINSEAQQVYVTDTLRDRVYILDMEGKVVRYFGRHGTGSGEFNLPTEVYERDGLVAVVDALNFRIQLFDRNGNYQGEIRNREDTARDIYRPKGVAIDSEGHIYLVDAHWGMVEVFDREGRLLYRFGNGTGFGQFLLPSGLFIDRNDRIYLVDSYNRRVQIFQYHASKDQSAGAMK